MNGAILPQKNFTSSKGAIASILETVKGYWIVPIFSLEIPFVGTLEIPLGTFVPLTLELVPTAVVGLFSYARNQEWAWLPWWWHLGALFLLAAGFMKRSAFEDFKVRLGLDPTLLRMSGVPMDPEVTNNPASRFLTLLAFSFGLATFVSWYWNVSYLSYQELGVKDYPAFTAFLNTWFTFVIPAFWRPWTWWFLGTFSVLLISQRIPFLRWILKRTMLVHVITMLLWLLLVISVASWWNDVSRLAY